MSPDGCVKCAAFKRRDLQVTLFSLLPKASVLGSLRIGRQEQSPVPGLSDEVEMKKDIHPRYVAAKITCACGASFETRSSKGDYNVDVCALCHPFYTGKMKLVDTQGRVERFRRKYASKSS